MFRSAIVAGLIAVVLLCLSGTPASAAGSGVVTALPLSGTVAVGEEITVTVTAEPPDDELSIWIVEVWYDPSVIQIVGGMAAAQCQGATLPSEGVGASTTLPKDRNFDFVADAFVPLGGYVRNDGGVAHGLSSITVLGSCTFVAVGSPGDVSPLEVHVTSFVTPNSTEPNPATVDGSIELLAAPSAPAVGGVVELMSVGDDGSSAGAGTAAIVALLALVPATAWLARRRIMRR